MKGQLVIKKLIPILGNFFLVIFGLAFALVLVEIALRTFPNLVPAGVRVNPPARRVKANIDETYELKQSDGDLYHHMRGAVLPLSPDQDRVVDRVHMITDAQGFRNPPPEKATYDIVALGDSFTRASGVATPWPQRLSEYSGSDVFNLSDVGFGPQDELKVLRQYGLKKQPQLVILAYFEGNDLYDAASYEQANPFILLRYAKYIYGQSKKAWQERRPIKANAAVNPNYRYPITITINHKELELVFFSSYISWLSISKEAIAASQDYRLVIETILQVRELSEKAGANFLLVYLPSKSHVYLPYVNDGETLARIFTDVQAIELDDTGYLQFRNKTVTPELVRQHMDDQASLMADFAKEQNINFLDLTSAFQREAGAGAELFYLVDTHWNQMGHDLAAETIYSYIKEKLPDTAIKTPGH